MAISPFPKGQAPQSPQPATAPRQMITELSTETHEFPRERGTPLTAAQPSAPAQAVAPTPPPPSPAPPSKTYAETNAEFFSIELPSTFLFYDNFKSLSARTLTIAHQAKFSRAAKEERLRYTVEAVSATLEPDRSAFDLSVADFYFLLYWHRVNSYSKNPMLVTSFCDNVEHNEKVHMGYEEQEEIDDPENPGKKMLGETVLKKMPEESLRNETLLNNTTLETKYLDPLDLSQFAVRQKYDLHIETMRDVVETTEYITDNDVSEEELFLLGYVPFLRRSAGRETIKERMAVAAEIPSDDLEEIDRYIEAVTNYGVAEYAVVKCKGCGASSKVKLTLDALTFLPSHRRA